MDILKIYDVISPRFRRRRMRAFEAAFRPTAATRILDVGGRPANWRLIDATPSVTLVNPEAPTWELTERMTAVRGDGCNLPFADGSLDVAYSNSTIEHLGGTERQEAFARELRRVGRRYYVQTPNRWFPLEPHYLTPFVHFLPRSWQVKLLRHGTVWGWVARPTPEQVAEVVKEIRLLDHGTMRRLFPEARIERERLLGLTKSLIAIYDGEPDG